MTMTNLQKTFICGCARNCAPFIPAVFANIEEIAAQFDDYMIVIAYDESTDQTLRLLAEQKRKHGDKMAVLVNRKPLTQMRTQNIANARNSILDYIRSDTKRNDFDFFIMIDCDDVCAGAVKASVLKMYLKPTALERWDALSFNRQDYYDIWALSATPYIFSCWHWERPREVVTLMRHFIRGELNRLGANDLYECYSAFNGFAIYKRAMFLDGWYEGTIEMSAPMIPRSLMENQMRVMEGRRLMARPDDCEHRHFHFQAVQNKQARVRISPFCLFKELSVTGVQNA